MDFVACNAGATLVNGFHRSAQWIIILDNFWEESEVVCGCCRHKARAKEMTQYCPDCGCYMTNGVKND